MAPLTLAKRPLTVVNIMCLALSSTRVWAGSICQTVVSSVGEGTVLVTREVPFRVNGLRVYLVERSTDSHYNAELIEDSTICAVSFRRGRYPLAVHRRA